MTAVLKISLDLVHDAGGLHSRLQLVVTGVRICPIKCKTILTTQSGDPQEPVPGVQRRESQMD